MLKNLTYAALGLGGVALAATLVMTAANNEPPKEEHMVTLDANGGMFLPGTSTVQYVEVAYSNAISQAFNAFAITNINHDFVGWTATKGGNDFIPPDTPVISNMACFAKWERSAIQKFNVTNCFFEGEVVQFPAVFYGTVWAYDTTNQVIHFKVPQNATSDWYRVSFDPQAGQTRLGTKMTIVQGGLSTNITFTVPTYTEHRIRFIPGADCVITFWPNCSAAVNYARYAVGIGLEGVQVTFDSNDGGKGYGTQGFVTANYTRGYPYGVLPDMSVPYGAKITFKGWYPAKDAGVALVASDIVGTNELYYAQWKFPSVPYTVKFNKDRDDAEGFMEVQPFMTEVEQALSYNRFYLSGHKFIGWATSAAGKKKYDDGEKVINLTERPDTVVDLFAVWRETPGTNSYTVSQYVTEFKHVALSSNGVTFVNGTGSYPTFTLAVTNSADLRVSLDPNVGCDRAGAKLTIYKEVTGGSWSNVCEVTDLATTNTVYSFKADTTYRFDVTGVGASYAYVVGLGAKGAQIGYDSCGVQDMSFNWTVDTPYGYWPTLTSAEYGKHLGWFYDKDIANTNEVKKTESVVSNATIYAHWANQPYSIAFDGNGATQPTQPYVQDFFYNKPQALSRNQFYLSENKFLGWHTNSTAKTELYKDGATVSNLCSIAGGTNALYAVWQNTPGTNWYYVAGTMTSFENVEVTPSGKPTYFVGKGDAPKFFVTTKNANNCRIAIDPVEGELRTTNMTLTVFSCVTGSNKWTKVSEVSALSEKAQTCSFTTTCRYKFEVAGFANTNSYVVSIGAEGARYIFDACGGNFVGEKKETTKVKFYNWTVGSPIGYLPALTTNKWVHGKYEWHYTPLINETNETTLVCTTNAVVSGGEKIYAIWPDSVIVGIVFNWNLTATNNIVFTNYYGQGATVDLYNDDYVRQPIYDGLGFLGWTTNQTGTLGWKPFELAPVTTNSPKSFFAQWTDIWKTSRFDKDTLESWGLDAGLSINGYYGTLDPVLKIPTRIDTLAGIQCPVDVVAIGDSAFEGCTEFSKLDVPATVKKVGGSAFEDCTALTKVTFEEADRPDEYAKIGDGGFLDGIVEDGTPSVELCECLFKGCTSLTDVELPLGVNCIPDECFRGCTSLQGFDKMPYTVITIGSGAFAGCTHLTNVVHTEIVDEIGSGAFKKCARLKFISFIGDNPEAVESDILKATPRNVLVRYLPNMCETAKDYCGGDWPALPGLWPVAGDTNSSRRLTWLGGKYPRRKVVFNYNDNEVLWKCTQEVALYHTDRVFGLLAPTADEMDGGKSTKAADDEEEGEEEEEEEKTGFTGWYTQPVGGRKVGNYWVVPTASEGDSAPITVYAHWGTEEDEGAETGSRSYGVYYGHDANTDDFETFPGFYSVENEDEGIEGDDMFYYSACTFNGIVIDTSTDNNAITGTVEFVFQDATYPEDGGMQSAFTATVTWNGGKKTTLSGVADAEGYLVATGRKWSLGTAGDDHRTVITKSGLNGWLTDLNEGVEFRIYAARNRTAQATEGAARSVVLRGLQATRGTWHVVLGATATGEGEAFAQGYSTLSITIANMGQATITGTLGDGTKVSTTSTLIVGDGCCCLPVSIRPYGGKGGFSFMLWFTWHSDGSFGEEDASIQGLTGWDASMSAHPFTATFETEDLPLTFIDEKRYTGDAAFESSSATASLRIEGASWKIVGDNPSKLKISYNATTGIFSGSFAAEVDGKTSTAAVSGVFTDRIDTDEEGTTVEETYRGYGTAVIQGVGSEPVVIETLP